MTQPADDKFTVCGVTSHKPWNEIPLARRIVTLVVTLYGQHSDQWYEAAVKQVERELAHENPQRTD